MAGPKQARHHKKVLDGIALEWQDAQPVKQADEKADSAKVSAIELKLCP